MRYTTALYEYSYTDTVHQHSILIHYFNTLYYYLYYLTHYTNTCGLHAIAIRYTNMLHEYAILIHDTYTLYYGSIRIRYSNTPYSHATPIPRTIHNTNTPC